MKTDWKTISARIDALSLRERAFLFLSLIVVCVALVDRLWVAPAQLAHRQAAQGAALETVELQRLREEYRLSLTQPDPETLAREEIRRVQAAIATTDQEIAGLLASSRGAASLADVMVHFLRRHAALVLLSTGNLAPEGAAEGGRSAAPGSTALARQGLELTVAGPYPELVRYVRTLEGAMPQLRWGSMKLSAEQQPPQLTLQVFLLGPQP